MSVLSFFTSGGLTWLWGDSGYSEATCINKANATAIVQQIDAKTSDLAKNWHPTGYYTSADIRTITGAIIAASMSAKAAVAQSPLSTVDAKQAIAQAIAYLDKNIDRSKAFVDAAAKADQSSGIVDAPAFKTWVTNSLVNISQAYVTLMMLSCAESMLQHGLAVVNDIIEKCKQIALIAIDQAANAVKASFDVIAFLFSKKFRYGVALVALAGLTWFVYPRAKTAFQLVRSSRRALPPGDQ